MWQCVWAHIVHLSKKFWFLFLGEKVFRKQMVVLQVLVVSRLFQFQSWDVCVVFDFCYCLVVKYIMSLYWQFQFKLKTTGFLLTSSVLLLMQFVDRGSIHTCPKQIIKTMGPCVWRVEIACQLRACGCWSETEVQSWPCHLLWALGQVALFLCDSVFLSAKWRWW